MKKVMVMMVSREGWFLFSAKTEEPTPAAMVPEPARAPPDKDA